MKESGHLDVISDLIFYLLIKGRINIFFNFKLKLKKRKNF